MDEFAERVARQIGRRARRRRRFLDLSQEAVAERAGLHRTQVSLIESGERVPRAATLLRLAAAIGVSVDQLLGGIEWEVPVGRPRGPADGRTDDASAGGDDG